MLNTQERGNLKLAILMAFAQMHLGEDDIIAILAELLETAKEVKVEMDKEALKREIYGKPDEPETHEVPDGIL